MDMQGGNEQTIIREDVEITGAVKATGGIRLDGRLNGDLNSAGDVAIGKSAAVKGNMVINNITVNGRIDGNISARDRVELKAAARISGDVKAKRLTVEDGVSFVGKVEVNPAGLSQTAIAPEPLPADHSAAESEKSDRGKGLPFLGRK